ncbi:3-methyl-2-oxobutanoate hydroxymethyltransferase [Asticcacaulis taihuensis]|uniref:3-methyl-2-oxobutanoate hydroxymethyltransferase n=1 Tax=Asticcacaulis taihuensis TaxID=260084 RepID=A0A1G4PE22_9CAUL|nr:3-methyl-2-oxobutanoate hydroxymethyltransferase [Asticcacaulis taihuensis]SCW30490.1 3-methyl-2-oxobutanoate hydroxymethyltransferase [Asticcacaulis taihuensis]
MSSQTAHSRTKRLTAPEIRARKGKIPLVVLTAYTTPMARIMDPHCDILLVGDSLGMVIHGLPNTIGVTMDMMILHGQAVMRGADTAFVVVDMPFGSYEAGVEQAFANAVRLLKDTGAQAVKVESGPTVAATIRYLTERGIPVMGHVGLRPQAVNVDGGFKAKGRTEAERLKVIKEAQDSEAAGAFSIVVEGVAADLAAEITKLVSIPTIGIGASADCDGQVLVTDDMLGLFDWTPKFVRHYADLRTEIGAAVEAYAKDVRDRSFPAPEETYFAK